MKSRVMTLRVNPTNESELYQFVESKGGIKKAINYLYNHYKLTQRVDKIVNDMTDKIKNEIDFTSKEPTRTEIKTSSKSKNMVNSFLK